jgi:hypothetical protein
LEKYPYRQLAGGLLYLTYGSNGGIGETCRKVTRPDPTHLSHSDVGIRVGAEGAVAGGTRSGDHSGCLHRSQLSKRKGRGGNGRILGAHVAGLASPHGLVRDRGVVLDRRNAPKQQFTPQTLPHVRYGLSVLLIEAFLTLGVSSICPHVQHQ